MLAKVDLLPPCNNTLILLLELVFIGGAINGGAPVIGLAKSRGTAPGINAIVLDGDPLGTLTFSGDDGTDLNTQAASITAEVDGTPGANDMPGRLTFSHDCRWCEHFDGTDED